MEMVLTIRMLETFRKAFSKVHSHWWEDGGFRPTTAYYIREGGVFHDLPVREILVFNYMGCYRFA